ncbi:hypothetical protein B0T22DRAFT_470250 [Podospora appendiculata]|uniref:Uncharacterized protein n=1 Tax=Podospora appendiculata TaxID=314037 RepID=A0AAE0X0S9_9PEZI|nr:hypothetical protein B0T22DRAFT_470250 [Podospora appendiculata]
MMAVLVVVVMVLSSGMHARWKGVEFHSVAMGLAVAAAATAAAAAVAVAVAVVVAVGQE